MSNRIEHLNAFSMFVGTVAIAVSAGCGLALPSDPASSGQASLTATTTTFEAESLTRTSSAVGTNVSSGDCANSNCAYAQFNGTAAINDWIEFTLPGLAAGTYDFKMHFKANNNRGINRPSLDGAALAATCDEYAPAAAYQVACSLGSTTLAAGSHRLRFTVTGKNNASTGYSMTIDKIVLTSNNAGSGGATGSGGGFGTGGATGSGGVVGTGGATGSGGVVGSGGATGSGGVVGSGGATATGGVGGSGGGTGTPVTYEAETLTRSSSAIGTGVVSDANASGGAYVQFNGTPTVNDWIEFTIPSLAAGAYDLAMYFKSNTNRGMNQASLDGATLGSTCDEYRTSTQYGVVCTLGRATVAAGSHRLRFTLTGKNASSSGYTMTIDKIVLTGTTNAKCPAGWSLAWSDEFDGPAGTAADANKWGYDTGNNNGWGNGELEYYQAGNANAALDGSGNLVITSRRETVGGFNYTSARLKTQGKFSQAYGRFEARVKIPFGQGMWPAFWMMGDNIDTINWPGCGEIDVLENIGREPNKNHGVMHGPGYSGAAGPSAIYTLPGSGKLADAFHTFALEWETNVLRWYVDGQLYSTKTPSDIGAGHTWVFDHPFFIILNNAVGGGWPGNPDSTTVFPQTMTIDYVRVCRR